MPLLDYLPILILAVLALVVSGVIMLLSTFAGRPFRSQTEVSPYECGVTPLGNARERFSVKFYLIGVLFILFDIEIVFLYPWAVTFDQLGLLALVEMLLFMAILFVGYAYVWKKGALEWD
ncbi:MAG: NADH-quinone oxidoreductase subunit A [Candidatus Eisenbacteria bacterium]